MPVPRFSSEKHGPYYEFTNFSPHEVVYEGRRYPTSECLFQAFKVCCTTMSFVGMLADATVGCGQFLDGHPQIAERIRTCGPKPASAFDEAHRHRTVMRSDWPQVHVSKVCPVPVTSYTLFYSTRSTHTSDALHSPLLDGNGTEIQVYTT